MALPVVTVGHLDLNHKLKVICKKRRNSQQQIKVPLRHENTINDCLKCKCISNINTKCYGGNMLNKYWIEKLERGKQIREVNILTCFEIRRDLKWGAYSRRPFRPNSSWGSIKSDQMTVGKTQLTLEMTTIRKTQPTLFG